VPLTPNDAHNPISPLTWLSNVRGEGPVAKLIKLLTLDR